MPLLDSISIDYAQEEGLMIVPTIVSTEIYALSDSSSITTKQQLNLGASGDIVFFVDDTENSLTLSVSEINGNMQISTSNSALELLPNDEQRTIYLHDLIFKKEVNKNVITTKNSATSLEIASSNEILLKSKVNVLNDLNIEGKIYAPNLNIANGTHGFMFQLSDESNLELIKYDKNNNYGQLVATFGQGSFIEDINYPYSNYGGSVNSVYPTNGGGGDSVWSILGSDILYLDGNTAVQNIEFRNSSTTDATYIWDGFAANLRGLGEVGLSTFSNDMNLESLDPNINSTSIITSNLTVQESATFGSNVLIEGDVTISSNLVVNSIEIIGGIAIQSMVFEDLANHEWNGYASNLYGLEDLALSALSNDLPLSAFLNDLNVDPNINSNSITTSNITVSENTTLNLVTAEELTISHIHSLQLNSNISLSGSIIPNIANVYNLGSIEFPFHSIYVGPTTFYIGEDVSMSVEGETMNIAGASLKPERGMEFSDGSKLNSMNDVAKEAISALSATISEEYGDFTKLNIRYNQTTIFDGEYSFSRNYITSGDLQYKIFDYSTKLIPIQSDGSGFSTGSEYLVKNGSSIQNITNLNITKNGNSFLGNNLLITGIYNSNIEYATQLKTFERNSDPFKSKFITDFRKIEKVYSKQFINENRNYDRSINGLNTTVEFISVYYLPIYETIYLDSANPFDYLVPGTPEKRLNAYYQLTDPDITSYTLVQSSTNSYTLYPKIEISDWTNSYNYPSIVDSTLFNGSIGWDSIETVFTRFDEMSWLITLFKLTYAYIKYGDVNYSLSVEENTMLENDYSSFNASNISFISEEIFVTESTTYTSKTKIVFNETTMAAYI